MELLFNALNSFLDGLPEDVQGTLIYVRICHKYAAVFLKHQTVEAIVSSCSEIVNFLRLWRIFIKDNRRQNLQTSFISRQTYEDIVLSCHFTVLLLRWFRDKSPSIPIELGITGTDVCESFFSENGSFVMNRHTYTFNDMLHNITKMNVLNSIVTRGHVVARKAHMKQEVIWNEGAAAPLSGTDVPSDSELCSYWEQGLEQAQRIWKGLGMQENEKFFAPHSVQLTLADLQYADEETDDVQASSLTVANASDCDDVTTEEMDIQLRQVCDEQTEDSVKHSLKIHVPATGDVFKSTVVSLLNVGDTLSKDRLKRVQGPTFITNDLSEPLLEEGEVELFSDVIFKHRNVHKIGRIQRLYTLNNNRRTEYVMPVSTTDTAVRASLQVYEKTSDNLFSYTSNTVDIPVTSISTNVNISISDNDSQMYYLEPASLEAYQALTSADRGSSNQTTHDTSQASSSSSTVQTEILNPTVQTGIDDRMVFDVEPTPGARSKRKRRVVAYLD